MNRGTAIKRLTRQLADENAVVRCALEHSEPLVTAPPAAYKALIAMSGTLSVV